MIILNQTTKYKVYSVVLKTKATDDHKPYGAILLMPQLHQTMTDFKSHCSSFTAANVKLQDGRRSSSVNMDTLATTYLNQGVTLTVDLQNLITS